MKTLLTQLASLKCLDLSKRKFDSKTKDAHLLLFSVSVQASTLLTDYQKDCGNCLMLEIIIGGSVDKASVGSNSARLKALLFQMLLALSKGFANVCLDATVLFSPLTNCVLIAFGE